MSAGGVMKHAKKHGIISLNMPAPFTTDDHHLRPTYFEKPSLRSPRGEGFSFLAAIFVLQP